MTDDLKDYQRDVLRDLAAFLEEAARTGAGAAFEQLTGRPFVAVPGLEAMPYVCLRVPTGGGKTLLAAHSIGVAADSWLLDESPVVLWLVPSDPILTQTLAGLRDRSSMTRKAIASRFGERVEVLTLEQALYAKPAFYAGTAVIIVSTIQAFRRTDPVGARVYRANGELKEHFTSLTAQSEGMLENEDGTAIPSLSNVLRLHRPIVLIDEAHGARTEASFETLKRFAPSLVLEFTATPVTGRSTSQLPSNVLVHVSAAQLKAEHMVKLPVVLRGDPDPRETLAAAIATLEHLNREADEERQTNASFGRPVMLIQAQPKTEGRETLHAEEVKRLLIEDFRRLEAEVVISTGEKDELEGRDLNDPRSSVRFVITQQKLREGWDCPYAYVLCSLADQRSERAVEQLLGRILRLPQVTLHGRPDLNQAYTFAVSADFARTATALKDGLVECGFDEIAAQENIRVAPTLPGFERGGLLFEVAAPLPSGLDLDELERTLSEASDGVIRVDATTRTLRVRGNLPETKREALIAAIPANARRALREAFARADGSNLSIQAEGAEPDAPFRIPRLVATVDGQTELFDTSHVLDSVWRINDEDISGIVARFNPAERPHDEAVLDVNEAGRVQIRFAQEVRDQLRFQFREVGWSEKALVSWLDRHGMGDDRRDIPQGSSIVFVRRALAAIMAARGLSVEEVARAKYRLRNALRDAVSELRDARARQQFQASLLPIEEKGRGLLLATADDAALVMTEDGYGYRSPYGGSVSFAKHAFRVVGDLEPKGEEHECAVFLDRQPWVKRWVRNTSRQPNSFWLQTSSDRFYPDFLAELTDGRHLVVEYKGEVYRTNDDSVEKNLIGGVWADRSQGRCVYVMVSDRQFSAIAAAVGL